MLVFAVELCILHGGLLGFDSEEAKNYVMMFSEFSKEPTALSFCTKIFMEMLSTSAGMAAVTIPISQSDTIRIWYTHQAHSPGGYHNTRPKIV